MILSDSTRRIHIVKITALFQARKLPLKAVWDKTSRVLGSVVRGSRSFKHKTEKVYIRLKIKDSPDVPQAGVKCLLCFSVSEWNLPDQAPIIAGLRDRSQQRSKQRMGTNRWVSCSGNNISH